MRKVFEVYKMAFRYRRLHRHQRSACSVPPPRISFIKPVLPDFPFYKKSMYIKKKIWIQNNENVGILVGDLDKIEMSTSSHVSGKHCIFFQLPSAHLESSTILIIGGVVVSISFHLYPYRSAVQFAFSKSFQSIMDIGFFVYTFTVFVQVPFL
ncbi:hypothetical protein BCR42DRAFT_418488 [Absidia repens]|uniref:Uncharacterized protein n=1 Tax=Absidia repens TaxID=90262 RepID=A0A1X2IBP6_9FUNG|nr:hypothetical protein BCR42DRAFT_418488 [Absidia repens]